MDELFEVNQNILKQIPEVVMAYRRQRFFDASLEMATLISNIELLITKLQEGGMTGYISQLAEILPILVNAQESKDYFLVADIFEYDVKSLIQTLQMQIQCEVSDSKGVFLKNMSALKEQNESLYNLISNREIGTRYHLCRAINGQWNCRVESDKTSFYMHSIINPNWAAQELIDGIWDEKYEKYFVWGLGIGHHVRVLLDKADYYQVVVLEPCLDLIIAAMKALDFSEEIRNERLVICWNKSEMKLLSDITIKPNEYALIYYPSLRLVEDKAVREALEEFFVKANSIYEHGTSMISNFKKLQKKNLPSCEELANLICGRKVVIVAGGPSVDEELENIKKLRNEIVVFAVGRITLRLQNEGIKPDLMIATDPGQELLKQFDGIQFNDVPLILLSTAYFGVEEIYPGPVYLAYQKGYLQAEEVAEKNGYMIFETGGSVSTTATDIAIRFGAERIIFVGLDLAYTNGLSHAVGANEKHMPVNDSEYRQVLGARGNKLNTVKILDSYRKWIERRIMREEKVKFFNTGSGAHICGTIESNLPSAIV